MQVENHGGAGPVATQKVVWIQVQPPHCSHSNNNKTKCSSVGRSKGIYKTLGHRFDSGHLCNKFENKQKRCTRLMENKVIPL